MKANGHDHARFTGASIAQSHYDRLRALVTLIALHPSRDEFHKTMALLPMLSEYQRLPNSTDD